MQINLWRTGAVAAAALSAAIILTAFVMVFR